MLPSQERLTYIKLVAEVLLLVLLVPLALYGILRDPHHASDKAIGRAM